MKYLITESDWQWNAWNPNDCSIEKCHDGKFAIVDHNIQCTIAVSHDVGETGKAMARAFLGLD